MSSPRRIGVILAAGRGRRMGRTKQLVAWPSANGPKPLVVAAYDAVCDICDQMVVVVGHDALAVQLALGDRKLTTVHADPDVPMFESIRAGLEAVRSIDADAVVVLQPGDHPQVAAATLQSLVEHSQARPNQAIIPEYHGKGGHPVLIPSFVAAQILQTGCPSGLGDFWLAHPQHCARVPLNDPTMCRDIDTPGDLPQG